jgi:AraC family transcriptional regulator, regulatory protein of adaptative response / methylated-DNA-[protein]-cysteine methyltransferase
MRKGRLHGLETAPPPWVGAPVAAGDWLCKAGLRARSGLTATFGRRDAAEAAIYSLMPMQTFDQNEAWVAFERRDRAFDGRFVVAVITTSIYCKPSCPARRPKRENVLFLADGRQAKAEGFRPCLRCRPDDIARDSQAIARAAALIEHAQDTPTLAGLASSVGYAPHHFQRLFKRALGVSPAQYARALRAKRAQEHLKENGRVTDAIYDSGYCAPSSFYQDSKERMAMTPSAWRGGGRGETIRWTIARSALGPILIAATSKGICRLTFDDSADVLARIFPNATLVEDDGSMAELVEGALAAIERPAAAAELPIDVAGTAFQEKVWLELRKIPPGETRSYAQIAAAIGQPGAVRAVGSANGDNHVAVLIPCHRVIRSDGSLGGYAGGLDRKRRLLDAEGVSLTLL